jgi:comEA protein
VLDHFGRHISRASCTEVPRISLLALSSLLIVMVSVAAQVRADTKHAPPAHSIDVNSATAEQLQQVPGIGPGTAKAIVNFRQKSGPFQKVEDLLAIKGISKARFEKMRPYLTIAAPPQKSP